MSDSYLNKEKGKSKRGLYGEKFNDYPLKVKKYYDRKCGSIDGKLNKMEILEKEDKKGGIFLGEDGYYVKRDPNIYTDM